MYLTEIHYAFQARESCMTSYDFPVNFVTIALFFRLSLSFAVCSTHHVTSWNAPVLVLHELRRFSVLLNNSVKEEDSEFITSRRTLYI